MNTPTAPICPTEGYSLLNFVEIRAVNTTVWADTPTFVWDRSATFKRRIGCALQVPKSMMN